MTQILIQTKGFELTPAIEETGEKMAAKLAGREGVGEKVELFLEYLGRKGGREFSAKISFSFRGKDIFVETRGLDLYRAVRAVGRKARSEISDEKK